MAPCNVPHSPSTFENPLPDCSSREGSHRTGSTSCRVAAASRCVMKKARKRKSRAHAKPVIKELLADKLNFRDMVHRFTGQKTASPSATDYCPTDLLDNSCGAGTQALLSGMLAQSLRAVDTISAFLLRNAWLLADHEREKSSFLQGDRALQLLSALPANVMTSLELASSNYKGVNKQQKMGLLACLNLLKQIISHSRLILLSH